MESGGEGVVMLPLFRERGRHARTPLGTPRDLPSPPLLLILLLLAPLSHRLPPCTANLLSAPRNVNSRRFNSYEYFPRAWGRSRVAEKTWAKTKKRKNEEKEKGNNKKKKMK